MLVLNGSLAQVSGEGVITVTKMVVNFHNDSAMLWMLPVALLPFFTQSSVNGSAINERPVAGQINSPSREGF